MATFSKADPEVNALLQQVLTDYYPEIKELGVTFVLLWAHPAVNESTGEPKGPALLHHGYPAVAIIKITSHADRVAGLPDVVLKIDKIGWDELPIAQQIALLDHEVMHLEPVCDDQGNPLTDDCCRPKLRCRPHDFQVGGFTAVVHRHKRNALELVQCEKMHQEWVQKTLWG